MSDPLNGASSGFALLGLSRFSAFIVSLEASRQLTIGILSVCLLVDFDGGLSEWLLARMTWTPWDTWQQLGDMFGGHNWDGGLLGASGGCRPGTLLDALQYFGQTP